MKLLKVIFFCVCFYSCDSEKIQKSNTETVKLDTTQSIRPDSSKEIMKEYKNMVSAPPKIVHDDEPKRKMTK